MCGEWMDGWDARIPGNAHMLSLGCAPPIEMSSLWQRLKPLLRKIWCRICEAKKAKKSKRRSTCTYAQSLAQSLLLLSNDHPGDTAAAAAPSTKLLFSVSLSLYLLSLHSAVENIIQIIAAIANVAAVAATADAVRSCASSFLLLFAFLFNLTAAAKIDRWF